MERTDAEKLEPFVTALHRAVFGLDRAVDRMLVERFGLTFSQFFVLRVLSRRPGTTQREIAAARGLTEAAVSRSVDILARKRLVSRAVNPSSRRERVLKLTGGGRAVELRARRAALGMVAAALGAVSAADRRVLERVVERLAASFCAVAGARCVGER